MDEFNFNIGAVVTCRGDRCGRLTKVAVDPQTAQVTDLIIETGVLGSTWLVLPVSAVMRATEEAIDFDIPEDTLRDYPSYREVEYTEPDTLSRRRVITRPEVEHEAHSGMLYPPTFPTVRHRLHEGVSADKAVLERGTEVRTADGAVGHLDHLRVDRETDRITHLVIDRGLLAPGFVVPIQQVRRVQEDVIYIETERDLADYDRYIAREEADIWRDLREHVEELAPDGGITMTLDRGVLRLTGIARNVATKRRLEAASRSVGGIIDVENELDTDTAIVARVVAALAVDPRTELAVLAVASRQGEVRLIGQVDDATIRHAAGAIAAEQPGVVGVRNELEIAPDDATEWLMFRPTREDYPNTGRGRRQ
jgi:osmotically-inducible protein OsmY/sporulation protein YlmC with PRC-barrel domain